MNPFLLNGPAGTIVAKRKKENEFLIKSQGRERDDMATKRSMLQISLVIFLAVYLAAGPAAMLVKAQTSSSSGPSGADYDTPVSIVQNLLNILQTLPFDLFEVDANLQQRLGA